MLTNYDFNIISIDNHTQEIFLTFMLPLCVFFTSSLTIEYMEVIDFTRKYRSFNKINTKEYFQHLC